MPLRYVINLILIVAVWFVLNSLIQSGVITNYWSGILITVGINIILATSLNVATGYLGQLPLGHAGFMAVGAYAGGIFMKAMPVQELLKSGNTGAAIPYILLALLISAIVAGTFGIIIGILRRWRISAITPIVRTASGMRGIRRRSLRCNWPRGWAVTRNSRSIRDLSTKNRRRCFCAI